MFYRTLITIFLLLGVSTAKAEHVYSYPVEVVRIKDGDTFVGQIRLGLNVSILSDIRLKGYDAPEPTFRANNDEERRLGLKATYFLESLPKENWVLEVSGTEYDSFGRVLGNIKLPNGFYLKDVMINRGFVK